MTCYRAFALSVLVLSMVVDWPTTVQAETSPLRREFYGPSNPEFFAEFLDGHGSPPREKAANVARASSSSVPKVAKSPAFYLERGEEGAREKDRSSRNLDQIGGGNLLRRGLTSSFNGQRWLSSRRRNLDQIGGGNLLRSADDRGERNLDSIGGGNLVRGLGEGFAFRRNLDQIGGGNLVRDLANSDAIDDDNA
ncbi:hypothetical protein K0M31_005987 [Melipona bicolor]|uniref:Uncharacterized protein n=1 Tax=Melipona bicolor TaxID=60889 RepID=A0AA40FSM9_9HYME|nr:hypothetical protein K0M31_005987 [Melipona bicolor]